jgi:hypothetical protein
MNPDLPKCTSCGHRALHFPPEEADSDHGPLEGETWVCAEPGCPCRALTTEAQP